MIVRFAPAIAFLGLFGGTDAPGAPRDPSIHDIVHVTDISGLAASTDGKKVAFRLERPNAVSNSHPSEWHVADLARGLVRSIGSGGDVIYIDPGVPAAELPIWSADGAMIFHRTLVDGEVQLWRAMADGTGARAVVGDDSDIFSIRSADGGRALIFTTGPTRDSIRRAEAAEHDSGILFDQHVDLAQNVHRGALINGRSASQRLTGQWFARGGLLWREPLRERRLDLASLALSETQSLGGASKPQSADPGTGSVTSVDGDIATASWIKRRGSIDVRRHDGGGVVRCPARECSGRVGWLAWRPEHDQILFAIEDDGMWHSLFLWDLKVGTVRPVTRTEGLLSGGREPTSPCAVTAREAICVAAGAVSPPRLERIDLESGSRAVLFDPNEGLRKRMGVTGRRLTWKGADGHVFIGVLVTPLERPSGRVPLFITYYRCEGYLRGGVGDEWPLAPLAQTGMLSLCINNTPVAGPQDSLANNRAAAEGVKAIVNQLVEAGEVDRARVGMGGLSFGSEVAMWVAYNSNLLAAASISSPALEPTYYWYNGVRGRDNHDKLFQAWRLGAPNVTRARWKILSAALNVDRIRAPILMQMPEQEARVVPELYARLTNSPTPAELHIFPDEPHIKFLPRHKLAAYRRNLDWFRFWLQGYVDPDPLKRAQYERWSALDVRRSAAQPAAQDRRQSSRVARSKTRK